MKLNDAFLDQARSNRGLGSAFTAQVLRVTETLLGMQNPVFDRMRAWEGDISGRGAAVPLRFLGGLHALVLSGKCPELVAVYPPNPAPSDEALARAIATAVATHGDTIDKWLDNPPQTNEVRRSAVMIAGAHWLATKFGITDFVVSELGASAGLNLMWDKFRLDLAWDVLGPRDSHVRLEPEWIGPAPPNAGELHVRDRRGVDLKPMHPHDPEDALRLMSYLWPDQPWRMERAAEALHLCDAEVDQGDACDWLEERIKLPHPGAIHLITHTVAWQYFPEETCRRCLAALEAAGAKATHDAPIARLSMEADNRKGQGAVIELTYWPGGRTVKLGRVDFHGRWVDWNAPAEHGPGHKKREETA